MPRKYIHASFFFFLVTALSGVYMRYFPFSNQKLLAYENVLHAHSHLAILGWAFLGVFLIFLSLQWSRIKRKKQAIAICFTLFLVSLLMFFAFLWTGYALFSIIFSSLHIFAEYWVALFIYKHVKKSGSLNKTSALFVKGSLLALVISSIGPFSLGAISANGLKEFAIFDMAIYFYLHFQYNGWLTLALIGLFLMILHSKAIQFNESLLARGFWIYFISLFPGYFLSILWFDGLNSIFIVIGAIGSIGQWLAVIWILLALKPAIRGIKNQFSSLTVLGIFITAILLFVKSTFELGLISPTLATLVYETRSVIIGYLHLTLLGFVSIFILIQFFMLKLISSNFYTMIGFTLFIIGFTLNEFLLFTQALMEWIGMLRLPYFNEGLLVASLLLALGILFLWISFFRKNQSDLV